MFANTYKYGAQKPVNIPVVFLWPTYFLYGQLHFVYGQLCTFYMVNSNFLYGQLLLFIWSSLVFIRLTIYFLYGQLEFLNGQLFTFYVVNRLFIWSTFLLFISVCAKRRLHTGAKVQTEDCRSGVKCKLGSWRIDRLWPRYRPDREAQELSVERIEASDTKHHSKITLTFAAQDNGMTNRFLLAKQSKLPMCDGSLSLLLRPNKVCMSYVYVKATLCCSAELFISYMNKGNVFS